MVNARKDIHVPLVLIAPWTHLLLLWPSLPLINSQQISFRIVWNKRNYLEETNYHAFSPFIFMTKKPCEPPLLSSNPSIFPHPIHPTLSIRWIFYSAPFPFTHPHPLQSLLLVKDLISLGKPKQAEENVLIFSLLNPSILIGTYIFCLPCCYKKNHPVPLQAIPTLRSDSNSFSSS